MNYPWYELLDKSDEITQGDIIKDCPVPIIKNTDIVEGRIESEILEINGIILTQACDIANRKVDNIILCAVIPIGEFKKSLKDEGKNDKEIKNIIKSIIDGKQYAVHIIDKYSTDEFTQDYYIINFKDIFSVPLELAKKVAKKNGKRLRLCTPYREHLSQAFARFFMRVGLPINIDMNEIK